MKSVSTAGLVHTVFSTHNTFQKLSRKGLEIRQLASQILILFLKKGDLSLKTFEKVYETDSIREIFMKLFN